MNGGHVYIGVILAMCALVLAIGLGQVAVAIERIADAVVRECAAPDVTPAEERP